MHLTMKMYGAALMHCCDGCYHNIKWDNNACWWHWVECIVAYTTIEAQCIEYYRRHTMQTKNCLWEVENVCYIMWIAVNQQPNNHTRSIRLKCQYDGTNWTIYWLVNCLHFKMKEFLRSHKKWFRFIVDGGSTCNWFIGFVADTTWTVCVNCGEKPVLSSRQRNDFINMDKIRIVFERRFFFYKYLLFVIVFFF